jgi:hypothetical protein
MAGEAFTELGKQLTGFSRQLFAREEEKKREERDAPFRKLQAEALQQKLDIGKMQLKQGEAEELKSQEEERVKKLLADAIKTPVGRQILEEAFNVAKQNEGVQPGPGAAMGGATTQPFKQEFRPPTRGEQLQRVEKSPELATSQIPQVKEFRTGLQEEQKQLRRGGVAAGVREEEQAGRIELQELRGEQAMERAQLQAMVQQEKAKLSAQEKKDKKKTEQQDINAGIEAVLTLSSGVKPRGRILGFVEKVGKWTGFNPNLSSLDNTAGLLAGQVAKKIGGESGRLTDQDRVYALRVMPKSTDTKKEREIKEAVLRTFMDPEVSGTTIKANLYKAMGNLIEINKEKYEYKADEFSGQSDDELLDSLFR